MNHPLIEACVDSHASCMAAARGGADRLELCANLAIGGTTPSPAVFKQVKRDCDVKINVLIRPRFGDFLYSDIEMEEMCEEINAFRGLGANGVVIGALTPEGELDREKMARLMACAGSMDVTLHRAFDMTRDPFAALEAAIELGCRTILTSGQAGDAVFHTTGRKAPLDSGMIYRKSTVFMGLPSLSEYEVWQTDEEEFRQCAQIVHTLA